ncbi:MAG TPA: phage baseplate assembly protein V [Phycisphaerae bacterium]|nr:phage baseplate assembly protein V [Phycisphaerae bacterium]
MSGPIRTEERTYRGRYRGFVADVNDPLRIFRVRVRVPEVLGREMITDWATTDQMSASGPDFGAAVGLEVGTPVFVQFSSGDVNRPLVVGTWFRKPTDGPPDAPALTRSDGDTCYATDPSVGAPKGEDGFVGADGESRCQPASPLLTGGGPQYPRNRVLKTKQNGITIEVDDTPGRPRVHVYLGKDTASWLELDKDGLSVRVNGESYELTEGGKSVHTKGPLYVTAEERMAHRTAKDRFLAVKEDETRLIEGERKTFVTGKESILNQADFEHTIIGNRKVTVLGTDTSIVAGAATHNAAGQFGIVTGGVITLAGSSVSLGGGGSPEDPQNPETPPVIPSGPTCPAVPPAPPCPPLGSGSSAGNS